MRKLQLFMHVSLDGFVATPNKDLSWVKVDQEIFDYGEEFISQADTVIYGAVTFGMMENYWPTAAEKPDATKHDKQHSAWYKKVQKIVLSNKPLKPVYNNTRILSNNIPEEIIKIKNDAGKNILMLGSPSSAQYLMQHDLIDGFRLFINPVLLGSGIPLFKDVKEILKLKLVNSKVFTSGVVAVYYEKA